MDLLGMAELFLGMKNIREKLLVFFYCIEIPLEIRK